MTRKHLKFVLVLFMLTLISGLIFLYLYQSSKNSAAHKSHDIALRKNNGLAIRGLKYSGYHGGHKTITIKAARFNVEKKKIGIFKFSPLSTARFRGAEINFYVNHDSSSERLQDKRTITTKVLFSEETIPDSLLKGATSAVFEPVKINFCLDDRPVTEISAKRAFFEPLQRRIVMEGKIFAKATLKQLSTNRLMIYPEKGIIEVNHKFILKTQSEKISGEKLTTDLFLKKMDEQ